MARWLSFECDLHDLASECDRERAYFERDGKMPLDVMFALLDDMARMPLAETHACRGRKVLGIPLHETGACPTCDQLREPTARSA